MHGEISRPLTADYPDEYASKVFIMIKTGGDVMWNRLPLHLWTTLTHFPQFGLYSDKSGMIGGYEVIDILSHLSPELQNSEKLAQHKLVEQMQTEAWGWDVGDLNMGEGWNMDKFKNFPMLADAYERASDDTDWFVFMDADSYLLGGSLLAMLKEFDPKQKLYLGNGAGGFYEDAPLFFGHGGSGAVLSRGLVDALFSKKDKHQMVQYYLEKYYEQCCGDAMMGYIIYEETSVILNSPDTDIHGVGEGRVEQNFYPHFRPDFNAPGPFQGNQPYRTSVWQDNWCEPLVSFHALSPHDVEILWEWDQMLSRGMVLGYDWYRDFILPYILEERDYWDIGEGDVSITDYQEGLAPHISVDDCRKACQNKPECLGWRLKDQQCHLHTKGVQRGRAQNEYHKRYEGRVVSGWMLDRIRQIRVNAPCDPLEWNEKDRTFNDRNGTSEGWYFRALKEEKGELDLTHIRSF